MEDRQLLTVAINEFGGSAALNMTAGITTGPDGNLWFTETGSFSNLTGSVDRITPSGAIQKFTTGLSSAGVPTGITTGPDRALWFTEYGGLAAGLPFGNSAIGRIDPDTGVITEFSTGLSTASGPSQITLGPDGNLWFTENKGNAIGRITPNGVITEFSTGLRPNSQAVGITAGPNNTLWFAESNTDLIGRITTSGTITEFGAGIIPPNSAPTGITRGSDGNFWFTEIGSRSNPRGGIGRITTQGSITEFNADLTPGSGPAGIVSGPNGLLYFTEQNSGFVGQVTTQGVITEFNQNPPTSGPANITLGPDNNLWSTELTGTHVDRITTAGVLSRFPAPDALPTSAAPQGITRGLDGSLYFTEPGANAIGRIDTAGRLTQLDNSRLPNDNGLTAITTRPTDGTLFFIDTNSVSGNIYSIAPTPGAVAVMTPLAAAKMPVAITAMAGGSIWFTVNTTRSLPPGQPMTSIDEISPGGLLTEFPISIPSSDPSETDRVSGITVGQDGALYFIVNRQFASLNNGPIIGRLDPANNNTITFLNPVPPITTGGSTSADGIISGFDGALYFFLTSGPSQSLERLTLAGVLTEFPIGLAGGRGIVSGPDNAIYFTYSSSSTNSINRLNADGTFTSIPTPTTGSDPVDITVGGDRNLYFTESFLNGSPPSTNSQIGQVILPQSSVTTSSGGVIDATAGRAFSQVLTDFFDASTAANAANFSPTVDYGDGTKPELAVIQTLGRGFQISGSHIYNLAGQYTISVSIGNLAGNAATVKIGVNVTSPPLNSYLVTNTNDSGPGSLRQAILNADLASGATVTFAIPSNFTDPKTGVASISPLSPLPAITSTTTIDATSQATFAEFASTAILVQIDGRAHPSSAGLVFAGNSTRSVLKGISIFGFSGPQVELDSDGDTVSQSYIGLAAAPSISSAAVEPAAPSTVVGADGILVLGADAFLGGFFADGGNVISGNVGHGILFVGAGASSGLVLNNDIGTNAAGTAAVPNQGNGIVAIGGAGDLVVKFNLISGNNGNGIELFGSSGNLIAGNFVGVDVTGGRALSNLGSGICLDSGSSNNTVGGTADGSTNIISANHVTGVAIQGGSSNNDVSYNRIGTNCDGNASLGNGSTGILVSESDGNRIGPKNLVSGNGTLRPGAGIWLDGTLTTGNQVFGNHVGTDLDGRFAVPNTTVGIVLTQAVGNTIGGVIGEGNLVSGNLAVGVEIAGDPKSGAFAPGNVVQGNVIGLDASGRNPIGNGGATAGAGLYLFNVRDNVIGGETINLGNVISGNRFEGVELFGASTSGNLLQFNRIGTTGTGTGPCGNANDGLVLDATGANRIVSNYIDSNGRNGIFLSGATGTVLRLNLIGVGVGGEALGNGAFGILMANGTRGTVAVSNANFNNLLGPERNTDATPSVNSSANPANASVTGHKRSNAPSVSLKKGASGKQSVKVQPTSKSFSGRQVARANQTSTTKAKA